MFKIEKEMKKSLKSTMSVEESSFIVTSPKINMFEKDLSVHNPNLLNKNLSLSNHINLMRQSKEYRKLNKRRIIFLTNKCKVIIIYYYNFYSVPNIDSSIAEEKDREVDSLNTSKNEGNKNFDENPHYLNKNVENKSKTIKFESMLR